jgi:tetratricopeptide (TPR) repeat protein
LALAYLGRFDEADRQLRQTIEESGSMSARAHHLASRNLGTSLRLQGRYVESLQLLEKSIAASAIQPSHRGDHAQGLLEAGLSRLALGEFDAARQLFIRTEALFDDVQSQHTTPARANLLSAMARVLLQRGDYAAALRSAEAADLFWRDFDPENRWAGEAALWLGRCYLALDRGAEADEALSRAARVLSRSPIPSDAELRRLALERR